MLVLECSDKSIAIAAESVKNGRTVVYPTDTVYGIGCDPYDNGAIDTILRIKGREEGKPLPLLCSSVRHAVRIVRFNETAMILAGRLWPGPLTIIGELIDKRISSEVTAGTGTLGVRVPNHGWALKLIDKCNGVLVGTSANKSGYSPARSAGEVLQMLQGFEILLDGGSTPLGVESTVVDISNGKIRIVREGYITREEIWRVLGSL